MRLLWLTDIHLNFLGAPGRQVFFQTVLSHTPGAVLVGGDIAEATDLSWQLEQMAAALGAPESPVYFVLGNHDFHRSGIARTRREVHDLVQKTPGLIWLEEAPVIELAPHTALIGHGGWCDGRLGDYGHSDAELNDFYLIQDLAFLDSRERLEIMQELADEAAQFTRCRLSQALEHYEHVYYLTHVPPFREACWHEGHISDDAWLPFYTCQAVGDVLRELMTAHPSRQLTVLCGHSHSEGFADIMPNLRVLTGGAEYGHPIVQAVFDVE